MSEEILEQLTWLFTPAEVKKRGTQVGSSLPWPFGTSVYSLWSCPPFEVFIHERANKVIAIKLADSEGFFYLHPDPNLLYDALLVAAGAR